MTFRVVPPAPAPPKPISHVLFECRKGTTRVTFELIDRGQHGVEVWILHDGQRMLSHAFPPWHNPHVSPRDAAIAWAEEEREAIERG